MRQLSGSLYTITISLPRCLLPQGLKRRWRYCLESVLLAAFWLCASCTTSFGATYYWTSSGTGDWATASCWGGTSPTYIDTAYINTGGTASVAATNESVQYLYLGAAGSVSSGTAQIANSFYLANDAYIGKDGSGQIVQTGGAFSDSFSSTCYFGYNVGAVGIYTLSGTGTFSSGMSGTRGTSAEYIGYSGTGVFTQIGGTHNIADAMYLGYNAGGSGTYTLSGTASQINANYATVCVGAVGAGTFTQSSGTSTIQNLYLGRDNGGTGLFLLGGGVLNAATQYVGGTGTGDFQQSGGSNKGSLSLGSYAGGHGTYELTAGSFSGAISINTGNFTQSGGTVSAGGISINTITTGTSTYTLTGTSNLTTTDTIYVGYQGTGVFQHTSGTASVSSVVLGGYSSSLVGTGTYNLGQNGLLTVANGVDIGYTGNGTFNHAGGTVNITTSVTLGNATSVTGSA